MGTNIYKKNAVNMPKEH